MQLSNRGLSFPVSSVRVLTPYATTAEAEGVKIYHLNIGDPDIKTPEVMIEALHNWTDNPIRYAKAPGEPAFLSALESYYKKLGFEFVNKGDIVATVGGSEAIWTTIFAITNPGDEVLVFEPFYSAYSSSAAICNVSLNAIPTTMETGFHLPSREIIEKALTPKTKAILISNPANPTGTVYTKQEMQMLVDIAIKHNLFFISDEVYREFVYEGTKQTSILEFMQACPQNLVLIDSLSKRYSLCGARLGNVYSLNKDIVTGVKKIVLSRLSGGLVDQLMAAKLTEVTQEYLHDVNNEYNERRVLLYEGLKKIKRVTVHKPEGAFYMMVMLPVENAMDFCIWLLEKFRDNGETLMLAPGTGFYLTPGAGKNEVRMAYVINKSDLSRALELLEKGLSLYRKIS